MTIQNLIDWFSNHEYAILGYYVSLLLLAILLTLIVKESNFKQLRYVMSVVVFGVTVPGILALLLTLYSLLIIRTSLLNVSVISYFVPIITMVAVLIILSRKVSMSKIPGFDKLSSLMLIIGICFGIIFVLQRTYFGVLFLGSFTHIIAVFVVLFIILRIAWARLKR